MKMVVSMLYQFNTIYLVIIVCSKINGKKREPDNTSGVHGEANVFCLIEILRYFSCFKCIPSAECYQNHIVYKRHDEREGRDTTGEHSRQRIGINLANVRSLYHQPDNSSR